VIKVEDPEGGDYARLYPPLMPDGNSALFHALNRGKLSVQLDLKAPADFARFLSLVSSADVLVESFRPGVLAKLGASPEQLLARFPSLVVCSISGYGQSGPDALRAGHDVNYLAKAGALGMMQRPELLPVQVADIAGGSYPAAVQILAALRQKEKTGKGALIDVSMSDNVYALLAMPLARHAASGEPFSRGQDWLTGGTPCYGVYATRDEGSFLSVGALEPKFWSRFCKAIQRTDLIPLQFPQAAEEVLRVKEQVARVLQAKTAREWEGIFRDKDCCVEVVEHPEGLAARSAHLSARGVTLDVEVHGDGEGEKQKIALVRTPLRMTGLEDNTKPAPRLGQHNETLLRAKL